MHIVERYFHNGNEHLVTKVAQATIVYVSDLYSPTTVRTAPNKQKTVAT